MPQGFFIERNATFISYKSNLKKKTLANNFLFLSCSKEINKGLEGILSLGKGILCNLKEHY